MVDRRSFLHGAALSLGLPAVGVTGTSLASRNRHRWTRVTTPTSDALHAVARAATGPFAAGGNGILLERTDAGWTAVRRNGPGGDGSNLTTLGVTTDGAHLWMAGASGALGVYDVRDGTLTDRTGPAGATDEFTALAVTGSAGDANVYLADAAGGIHVSFDDGTPGSWTHLTPGSGASIHGLDCYDATAGMFTDGTGSVYATTTGTDWHRVGIDGADGRLAALDADGSSDVTVVGDHVYRRADGWTESTVIDEALHDVAVCRCGCIHGVGAGGTIVHRPGSGSEDDWRVSTPTGENLRGVALGRPHVAVGAGGTILER